MDSRPRYTLVTGASSKIGESIVRTLAINRRLIMHGRDFQRLQEIRAALRSPDEHIIWINDFECTDKIGESLEGLLAKNNAFVAELVHCAGIYELKPMRMTALDSVVKSFAVNYFSIVVVLSSLLKNSINSGFLKNVVFISSVAARFGVKGFSVYSSSKAALDGMMRSLSAEYKNKIRFNSILPGAISEGNMLQYADTEQNRPGARDQVVSGCPSDISSLVEFLLSDRARWITGQEIILDGGSSVDATE